jgi:hypothetical protein
MSESTHDRTMVPPRTPAPSVLHTPGGLRGPECEPSHRQRTRRILRRGRWENASATVIGLGILMQMQPFALELYTWSFAVIIVGTLGFLVTSHFPD